ncbi:MAG TPA: flavodoxin-dependent (E)-4-hydroxy-3-methylbut-2-enyl-diphosphate synthase [Acholeplasmataceae bacterium]|nr:flavodoxin-dependent (E)-4-hydroxy-3-methylbut-2-enyl-diphosphate synthase [Acholeplasmataceae bacterium]
MSRRHSRVVRIGNLAIGGSNPVAIQSMTNTRTKDVAATVSQIKRLEDYGCEIIRVAVLNQDDAFAIKEIKKHISIPIVADIHFDYRLALSAIESGVDKLRINPGNIGGKDRVQKVVEKCKEFNVPIRIGVNLGSLEREIYNDYGRTPKGLVASAKKHIEMLEELDFYDIVLSLKASDIDTTLKAYRLAAHTFDYPLHIGITEAGTAFTGTIKSAIGLGLLLNEGIGDTLRVSLATDPIEEVKVAKEILSNFNLYKKPQIIACPTCGRTQYQMFEIVNEIEEYLETLKNTDIKVAIMGCAVNGPGEAREADIGIAGGINEALLFKKGKVVRKIPQKEIIKVLKEEIDNFIKQN